MRAEAGVRVWDAVCVRLGTKAWAKARWHVWALVGDQTSHLVRFSVSRLDPAQSRATLNLPQEAP